MLFMSLFSPPPRAAIPEWVDDPATPEADLWSAMEGIVRVNKVLAYPALVAWLAERELGRPPRRVLDVGTGLADIPVGFAVRGRSRGNPVEAVGIDLNSRTIDRARALTAEYAEIAVHPVDLFDLPAEWEPFDVVTCHRTLHHLGTSQVGPFIAGMDAALAPGGVLLVGDLVRGRFCAAATWAFLSALGTSPITVRDGVASIRNSFLSREILDMAAESGVSYLRTVSFGPPCHALVIGRKPDTGPT
jgi:2-polyprenyl-3-methyl-5-hydroxy-6-metoxy-1,4-benzoquinol methylase